MATLTETPETITAPAPIRGRFLAAFAFGVLAVLALVAGTAAAFERSFEGRILPGIRAGGVDIGGLTPEAAQDRLLLAHASLAQGALTILAGTSRETISYADVARRVDAGPVVAEAMSLGRGGEPLERLAFAVRTLVGGADVGPAATFDRDALREALERIAAGLGAPATDAAVARTSEGGLAIIEGAPGRVADVEPAFEAAAAALSDPGAPGSIELQLAVADVEPAITTEEAEAAAAEAARLARDVTLTVGSFEEVLPGTTIDAWISFATTSDGDLHAVVDRDAPGKVLEAIAPKVAKAPVEPQFIVDGAAVVGIIPGVDGAALDASETTERLFDLLALRSEGIEISKAHLAITPVKPKLSDAEAASTAPKMQLISSWTTKFPYGIRNFYGANIWIPTSDINGMVLQPGETFDFWKAIGPISRDRGYGDGGAIINGRSEPTGALAGGICSTSTTLFNAALRAGLEMGARKNHYYYIGRYPMGLDATVYRSASGSATTMSFRNDTAYPILIRGYGWRSGSDGFVKFELYSVPTGRTVTLSTPIVKNIVKAIDTTEYVTTLAPGAKDRVETPHDAMDVWVTRTVRDASGAIIHQETYFSRYKRVNGILQIGVAPEPTPTPTPTPSSEPSPTPDPSPSAS